MFGGERRMHKLKVDLYHIYCVRLGARARES